MSKATTVDTQALKKDVQALGKRVSASSAEAVNIAIKQAGAFYMSFDETDSIPYIAGSDGQITVSGKGLENAGSVEEVLAIQTQLAVDTLNQVLQKGLKEALE